MPTSRIRVVDFGRISVLDVVPLVPGREAEAFVAQAAGDCEVDACARASATVSTATEAPEHLPGEGGVESVARVHERHRRAVGGEEHEPVALAGSVEVVALLEANVLHLLDPEV